MRKIFLLLGLLIGLNISAQQTNEQLTDYANTNINTNASNAITGAILNSMFNQIFVSMGGREYDPTRSYTAGKAIVVESNEAYICTTSTSGTPASPEFFVPNKWKAIEASVSSVTFRMDTTAFRIDTIVADIDTNRFNIDTLFLEIDTLKLRVDTTELDIQDLKDSIAALRIDIELIDTLNLSYRIDTTGLIIDAIYDSLVDHWAQIVANQIAITNLDGANIAYVNVENTFTESQHFGDTTYWGNSYMYTDGDSLIFFDDNVGEFTLEELASGGGAADTYQLLTDAATVVWDYTLGNIAEVTLTANRTLDVQNEAVPNTGLLLVHQDGTGGWSLTLPGGSESSNGGSLLFTSDPNSVDMIIFTYIGATFYWTLIPDFQ